MATMLATATSGCTIRVDENKFCSAPMDTPPDRPNFQITNVDSDGVHVTVTQNSLRKVQEYAIEMEKWADEAQKREALCGE